MTSSVTCHHSPWTAHTVGQRRAWHIIIALGKHTWSNVIGRRSLPLPLDITYGQTTSGDVTHGWTTSRMTCHYSPWITHKVGRLRALHAIITLGQQTLLVDVGRDMPSLPLGSTHG
uniref:Uncharacterized protein n=1 Tax=Solanum lycopersicum TaxID=4081 RepID=A0A3Q7EXS9_SOLLC